MRGRSITANDFFFRHSIDIYIRDTRVFDKQHRSERKQKISLAINITKLRAVAVRVSASYKFPHLNWHSTQHSSQMSL